MDENWPKDNSSPLGILTWPHKLLTTVCPEYDFITFAEDARNAVRLGELVLNTRGCAGLAANQVGIVRRFMVMRDTGGRVRHCINPVIMSHGKDLEWKKEGCMSFPGHFTEVPRWKIIDVQYADVSGVLCRFKMRNLEARIFQHERDHLDGLLIFKGVNDDS